MRNEEQQSLVEAAQEVLEACGSATSKLESQVARNGDNLPASYPVIVHESFAALERLRALLPPRVVNTSSTGTGKVSGQGEPG